MHKSRMVSQGVKGVDKMLQGVGGGVANFRSMPRNVLNRDELSSSFSTGAFAWFSSVSLGAMGAAVLVRGVVEAMIEAVDRS
jgi:hypothetical protein